MAKDLPFILLFLKVINAVNAVMRRYCVNIGKHRISGLQPLWNLQPGLDEERNLQVSHSVTYSKDLYSNISFFFHANRPGFKDRQGGSHPTNEEHCRPALSP